MSHLRQAVLVSSTFIGLAHYGTRIVRGLCALLAIVWLGTIASHAMAQTVEFTQNSSSSNNMTMQVPLASYPGRGISLPLNLSYSSKVWRIGYINSVYSSPSIKRAATEAIYAEHSTSGWTTSLDLPKVEWPKQNDLYWFDGKPYHTSTSQYTHRVARVFIHMPDGSTHELRESDQAYQDTGTVDMVGTFHAVDGSRMRYDSTGATTGTLYLSDGTRYVLNSTTAQYIDRNGNTLNYSHSSRQWTDTLGRVIGMPWPSTPGATDYSYIIPGYNGSTLTYTLKFRQLSDALTPGSPSLKAMASHYLPFPGGQPTNWNSNNFPQPAGVSSLFQSAWTDPEELDQTSYTYVVGRGQVGSNLFNPVVLKEIVLPNGQSYKFTYNIYGEIDKVIYPTGGYQRYQYGTVTALGSLQVPYDQGVRGVLSRWVSPNGTGTDEAQWQYEVTRISGYHISVTAPNGVRSETYLTDPTGQFQAFGHEDARKGLPIEERVYAPGGAMLRRSLTEYAQSTATFSRPSPGTGTYNANRNPRPVKTVSLFLDTGGNALTTAATFQYDTTYQFSVGLDRTSSSEYAFTTVAQATAQTGAIGSMPLGALVRSNETTYLTSNANYRNRNILGLPTSTIVRNASGVIVAQSTVSYDEAAYPLIPYGPVTGWSNPLTAYRGNVTTTSRWLDYPTSTWISTHAQYDDCGSLKNAWDALNRQSQIDYSSTYAYAYPTTTTSAVPDSTGTYGQTGGLVSSSVYDFNTGLVTSTTDPNGRVTSFEYNDSLNRPTRVNHPDGGWTATAYNDVPGDIYVHIQTLQQTTPTQQIIESRQFFDNMGRAKRSFAKEATTYITSDTEYDNLGRAWRVSNPYRTTSFTDPVNPTNRWTTSGFDDLSRVLSITTPDGSQATTAYGYSLSGSYVGTTVTGTDQRGKTRKSIADAQGRLIQVIEDPSGLAYPTNYTYDVLNNLRKIEQGSQLRYFGYDSFSRLIRVRNVEQAINATLTWTDPVTAYNGWNMGFSYNVVGNLTQRTDARGVVTTYSYDAINRPTTVRYTNDPQNTPGADTYYDGYRGGTNFNIPNAKGRMWQSETIGQVLFKIDNFDVAGRALRQWQQFWVSGTWGTAYQVQRTYNLASQITSQTYPSGHIVNYEFDQAGRTKKFSGNLGDGASRTYADNFQYSEWGTVEQEKFGTQTPLYHKRHYNIRGQVYDMRLSTMSWQTDQWNWNRGALLNWYDSTSGFPTQNGNSGTDNNGTVLRSHYYIPDNDQISSYSYTRQNYAYDALNRLTSVTELLNGSTQSYVQANVYDRYGNRTVNQSLTTANVPKPNFTADTATNRLVAPAGYSYTYDAAGNQINDTYTGGGQRTFDAENRMNSAQGNGLWQYYKYSGSGLRMRRIVNGFEVWQVYGMDGELLAEYPQNVTPTQPQKEYGYRNGQLLITAMPGVNIALNKPATQISDHAPTTAAAKAVDGDTNGALWENYSSATNYHANSWWQVDLQSVQNINSITVWGRTDCCVEMTREFYVFVSDNPFTSYDLNTTLAQPGVSSYYYGPYASPGVIAVNRTGRYVRVQLAGSQYLVMGEVQVWGGNTGQVNWLVPDHLGTPRMIADQTGTLANMKRHDYLPFGEEIGLIGGRTGLKGYMNDGTRQKFTGYERDAETGLDYAKARYDASAQGRFLSVDALMASAVISNPQSLNRYTYSLNNPVNMIDPTGHVTEPAEPSIPTWRDDFEDPKLKWSQDPKIVPLTNGTTELVGCQGDNCGSGANLATITITDGGSSSNSPLPSNDAGITTTIAMRPLIPGSPRDPEGDSIIEQVVSSPTQKMLELAAAMSQGVRDLAYALQPDYVGAGFNLPLMAGGTIQVSKDWNLYGSYNFFGYTGGGYENSKNWKGGFQVFAAYFATTHMEEFERDAAIRGPAINVTTGPVGGYFPLRGGTPAVTVGFPFTNLGVSAGNTHKIP